MLIVLLALNLAEAKNCRKGIPCGNTCISASKRCHSGSTSPRSQARTPPRQVQDAAKPPPAAAPAKPAPAVTREVARETTKPLPSREAGTKPRGYCLMGSLFLTIISLFFVFFVRRMA